MPRGGERVAKACFAVVEPVVVGHRRDVHSAAESAAKALEGRPEDERLRRRRTAVRDRGLEIHDGEVGTAEDGLDGSEQPSVGRGTELRRERALEVDVPAERELDRPTCGSLLLGRGRT